MRVLAWRGACLAVGLAALASNSAAAPGDLARQVADGLRKALPGYKVDIAGPLTVTVAKPSDPPDAGDRLYLDRIADFCARAPAGCQEEVSNFVQRMAQGLKDQSLPLTASRLRAAVRPADYVDGLNKILRGRSDNVVSAPAFGGLVMLCEFDSPATMQPVTTANLAKLGLSRQQALATCLKNTEADLPGLPSAKAPSRQQHGFVGYFPGGSYQASYLLLHDRWRPLAEAFHGRLLVAAPDVSAIFFTEDDGQGARDAMSALAKKAYAQAERPISQSVFRWTPQGWEVAVR